MGKADVQDISSVFIPAKEILSNAWNLDAAVKLGNVEFDDTYLDIIAAAKIDISRSGHHRVGSRRTWIFCRKLVQGK